MTLPTACPEARRVALCSMWRNDLAPGRRLVDRVEHLLAKAESYPALRFFWVVGDSDDETLDALIDLSDGYDVAFTEIRTGIDGDDAQSRLRRLSETANCYMAADQTVCEYVLIHESDILSPHDIVNRLVAHALDGRCPIAAWPTLELRPGVKVFYDCWGYRKDGQMFSNNPPYHPGYKPNEVFTVDSFGTLFLFDAADAPHIRMRDRAVLDLCEQLRARGRTLWVDPALEVVQPHSLWQYHKIEAYA